MCDWSKDSSDRNCGSQRWLKSSLAAEVVFLQSYGADFQSELQNCRPAICQGQCLADGILLKTATIRERSAGCRSEGQTAQSQQFAHS